MSCLVQAVIPGSSCVSWCQGEQQRVVQLFLIAVRLHFSIVDAPSNNVLFIYLFIFPGSTTCTVRSALSPVYRLRGANINRCPGALYAGHKLPRITCVHPRGTAVALVRDQSVRNTVKEAVLASSPLIWRLLVQALNAAFLTLEDLDSLHPKSLWHSLPYCCYRGETNEYYVMCCDGSQPKTERFITKRLKLMKLYIIIRLEAVSIKLCNLNDLECEGDA